METWHVDGGIGRNLGPHSLGKLIEWKLLLLDSTALDLHLVPTRWGN